MSVPGRLRAICRIRRRCPFHPVQRSHHHLSPILRSKNRMSQYQRVRLFQVPKYRSRLFPSHRPILLRHVLQANHLREPLSARTATKSSIGRFYPKRR
jgi:hypothetical protein